MTDIEVYTNNLENNPKCFHGPSVLFSRNDEKFYACSACRDRKDCSFYLKENDLITYLEKQKKNSNKKKFCVKDHQTLFIFLNEVKQTLKKSRCFCIDCNVLFIKNNDKHKNHNIRIDISDYELSNPSKFIKLLENPKKEAQFMFNDKFIENFHLVLNRLNVNRIICIGTPRLHEFIKNKYENGEIESLFLDIDSRYRQFFGPLEFCWYNLFNHYFFDGINSKKVFEDFLILNKRQNLLVIMDPPFGGRMELITYTMKRITKCYQILNGSDDCKKIQFMLILPYFMESHINNHMPDLFMCDLKVDYDNHPLFTDKPKGRKYGSPVRIFTNIPLSSINLMDIPNYKYCKVCEKWVYKENEHCDYCNECTSKDGRTYKHCNVCKRCVKNSWNHCYECNRCCLQEHECDKDINSKFNKKCFYCNEKGHKKKECPSKKKLFKRKLCDKDGNIVKKKIKNKF